MNTQTDSQPDANLIRSAFYGNAAFSGASGLLFLLAANPVSSFLGVTESMVIVIVGVVCLGYAALLFYNASRPVIEPAFALFTVFADSLWVLGSIVLLVAGWLPLTAEGKWAVAIAAMIVDAFEIGRAHV